MLVDWVTAHLSYEYIQPEDWQKLILMTERVMRFKPNSDDFNIHDSNTGEAMTKDGYFLLNRDSVVYETSAWESVKSDSHQIAFRVGSDAIWIQGSPARVCGSGDAVFGEGASGALDLPACVCRMAVFVSDAVGVVLDSTLHIGKFLVLMLQVIFCLMIFLAFVKRCAFLEIAKAVVIE